MTIIFIKLQAGFTAFSHALLRRKRDPSQTRSTLRRAHAAMRAPLSRDLAGNFKLLL